MITPFVRAHANNAHTIRDDDVVDEEDRRRTFLRPFVTH